MDSTDEKILNLMKGNARISYEELGRSLGMSRVAAMKRVKKLEKEGVIRGYNTYICREDETLCFIDIEAKPGKLGDVLDYIRANTVGIRQIYRIGEDKIHMVIVTDSVENLKYMAKMIRESCRQDLEKIRGSIVTEVIKDVYGGIGYEKGPGEGSVSNSQKSDGNP
ncbi:MAG: Lrp/AsnC family transcriptional regulator [Lachnospiraceae bacterium]|nr:Lrp/AsnC family transcriptional regulator [Lachnospiraceae bacterium]